MSYEEPQPEPRPITIGGQTYLVGGATRAEQDAKIAALKNQAVRDNLRVNVGDKVDNTLELASAVAWDWMEQYGDTSLMNIPFISNQIQDVGLQWPSMTANAKAEALQLGVSQLFAISIRVTQGLSLLFDVAERQIEAAKDVDAPPER